MSSFYGSGGGITQGGGGDILAEKMYICGANEYDPTLGLPSIANPEQGMFYLVPATNGEENNLFNQFIYKDGKWEKFGSGGLKFSDLVVIAGTGTGSAMTKNGNTASGANSFAEGGGTTASGEESHAEGNATAASGQGSHAEGNATAASGQGSHAEGNVTTASKTAAHAEGNGTKASGNCSHAEGSDTTASKIAAHAEGGSTMASGNYSHAEGGGTTASGQNSHAEGGGTRASGNTSHAEGSGTTASGYYSYASGFYTVANHQSQHVFGEYNVEDPSTATANNRGNYVEIVGNGTNKTKSNARTLDWDGNEILAGKLTVGSSPTDNMDVATKQYVDQHSGGSAGLQNLVDGSATGSVRGINTVAEDNNYTMGLRAVAEGDSTKASGNNSHAEGGGSKASGYNSHAEGNDTTASGQGSHAEGIVTTASKTAAHAEGNGTIASGNYSHVEGAGSTASGNCSHAEGNGTRASGNFSHAEGGGTTASGQNSHAEGGNTTASGYFSHVEGNGTTASGYYSYASGFYTVANHQSQHVFGEYNVEDPSTATANNRGNYVEIVGNGTSDSSKSNARTLDWSGNEVLAGKLTVGSGPANDMDVTTKQYVDTNISLVIDDIAGTGDIDKTWSADKILSELESAGSVKDVTVDGASIVDSETGVAEIPIASNSIVGVAKTSNSYGTKIISNNVAIEKATSNDCKIGTGQYRPVVPSNQHESTFYGLAKVAGDTTQSASSNAVGTYTDNAKSAIQNMLGIADNYRGSATITVTDANPVIQANRNSRYICGEVLSLDFTPCASGICEVIFTSGSSLTVLTLPETVKMPEWFEVETDHVYDISIVDGVYGAVMVW